MTSAERERLIIEHVSLVHHIAGRIGAHLPENVDREDLVSAGIIGLIKAIDRYDPSRGAKLATYASSVIRGEIMETLRRKDWAPRSVRRKARQISEATAELECELGRPATESEIASRLNMDIDEYREALDQTNTATIISLEDALTRDDDRDSELVDEEPFERFGDPADRYEEKDIKRVVADAVERLPEREQQVIALYYQEDLTLREIGEILDVTESRVCQIHTQAISRLRGVLSRELAIATPT